MSNNMAKIAEARKTVEQLKLEVNLDRMKVRGRGGVEGGGSGTGDRTPRCWGWGPREDSFPSWVDPGAGLGGGVVGRGGASGEDGLRAGARRCRRRRPSSWPSARRTPKTTRW